MTNPDELQNTFERPSSRKVATLLCVLTVLILVACISARPVWQLVKRYRAAQFLAEGRAFLEKQEFGLALERGRSALQLDPVHPDILRFNAELHTSLGGKASLSHWGRLVELGHATDEDLASYIETGLRFERADLVRDIASNMVARGTSSPRGERIAALYFAETGRLFEALHHARNARQADPANPTNAVLLADLLVADPAQNAIDEARSLYWFAARSGTALRPHSVRRLSSPPLGSRSDREQLAELLAASTNRSAGEDILLIETEVSLDPSRVSEVIAEVIASLPRDNLPRISAVADTLRRLGRYQEILRLTTGGREMRSPELFRARHAALVATGQIEEAYRLALTRDVPLPPYELELLRVRSAENTGDRRRRETHLRELVRAAGLHPVRLRAAAELAEELGFPEIAADGWKLLTQQAPEATDALRRLQRLADLRGDTWTAREFAQRAAKIGVPDPGLRLEIAHFDLLLEDETERALGEATRQVEARPDDFHARAVLALAHLRTGHPSLARSVLDRTVVDASTLRPDTLAILAAVYGENGLDRRARELASQLPLARLRPEERALLRPWLLPAPLSGGVSTQVGP